MRPIYAAGSRGILSHRDCSTSVIIVPVRLCVVGRRPTWAAFRAADSRSCGRRTGAAPW